MINKVNVKAGDRVKYDGTNALAVGLFCQAWDKRLSAVCLNEGDNDTIRILSDYGMGINDLLVDKGQYVEAIEYGGERKLHGLKVV